MSEYVRDERFWLHGLSASFNGRRAHWYSHDEVPTFLASIDWSRTALLCHNTHFDGLILSHHYDAHPAFLLDTMVMGRILLPRCFSVGLDALCASFGIPGKISGTLESVKGIKHLTKTQDRTLGVYANRDVNQMWRLFDIMAPLVPKDQLRLIDLTAMLFTEPVLQVDEPLVQEEYDEHVSRRHALFDKVCQAVGLSTHEDALAVVNSTAKLRAALEGLGVEVPLKANAKGLMIPAFAKTDLPFQAMCEDPDEDVRALCQARLQAKGSLGMTRAKRILSSTRPAMPVGLHYAKPRTLRWSGANQMNLQNLPRTGRLRRAFVAPPGYKINVVDSGQIEDRCNCYLSGQLDVLAQYRDPKDDPYKRMAMRLYPTVAFGDINKTERFVGKVSRLALGYGAGKPKFHTILVTGQLGPPLDISDEEATRIHQLYRETNTEIVRFWRVLDSTLIKWLKGETYEHYPRGADALLDPVLTFDHHIGSPSILLPDGNRMFYPNLAHTNLPNGEGSDLTYQSSAHGRSKIYGGKLSENVNQAVSKCIVADQVLSIAERYRVVSLTHDEVWYLSHWREGLKPLQFGLEAFSESRDWYRDIPLSAEGGQADNYGDAKAQDVSLSTIKL
jgi:hypothetical protein